MTIKILIVNHFKVIPPNSGGRIRIYYFFKKLGKKYNTHLSYLIPPQLYGHSTIKDNNVDEIQSFTFLIGLFLSKILKIQINEILLPYLLKYSFGIKKKIERKIHNSDVIIMEHPFLITLFLKIKLPKILVYDAHDVEYDLKQQYLKNNTHLSKFFLDWRISSSEQATGVTELTARVEPTSAGRWKNASGMKFTGMVR